MRHLPRVLVGLALVALSTHAQAQFFRTDVTPLEKALRRRNIEQIISLGNAKLAEDVDDPDGHALRGAAFSISGWPTEAVNEFELARGGDFYESDGQRYHAESLRDLNRGVEAAQHRRERRLVDTPNHFAYVGVEANIVDDLRSVGAWAEALDAADDLLATAPQNVISHATAAELRFDIGDDDEAMFQLFLAARANPQSYRYQEVMAKIAHHDKLYDEAIEHIGIARQQRPRLPRVRAAQLRIRCEVGEAAEALIEVDYPRFRNHAHPELLEVEAFCHHRNGDLERAREAYEDLLSVAPQSPHAQRATSYFDDVAPTD